MTIRSAPPSLTRQTGDHCGAVPPASCWYGLDIETDTTIDGLDATQAAIVAVAVSTDGGDHVIDGDERQILTSLDDLLAGLEPGLLITWNGTYFDLPFIAERAARHRLAIGLRLDTGSAPIWPPERRATLPTSGWWEHRHLDGCQLYRADLGRMMGLSCGLKPLAKLVGLQPVEVDRSRIHLLDDAQVRDYVASDARLARELVARRMPIAFASADVFLAGRGEVPVAVMPEVSLPTVRLR